jgi:N-glycosylase/DNA lyase
LTVNPCSQALFRAMKIEAACIERVVVSQLAEAQRLVCTLSRRRVAYSHLAWELSACVLGSRARADSVARVLENLKAHGLLSRAWWVETRHRDFERRVYAVLSGRARKLRHKLAARFPSVRASQIARSRIVVARKSLSAMFDGDDVGQLRRTLVSELPGIGPKQASLLLRNLRVSCDTAVLDAHFMRYLELCHGFPANSERISNLAGYERVERAALEIARSYGVSIAVFDLAVWSTMAAAREIAS